MTKQLLHLVMVRVFVREHLQLQAGAPLQKVSMLHSSKSPSDTCFGRVMFGEHASPTQQLE
jgi:hypothetical protein